MVDFTCKKFIFDDILKYSLGLTKKEFIVLKHLIDNSDMELTTLKIKDKLNLNLTTIQKAVKKLSEKKILLKYKKKLKKKLTNGNKINQNLSYRFFLLIFSSYF